MAKRKKLPDYTRRAIKSYESRRDRLVVMAPLGLKDRIKKVMSLAGFDSVSAFCVSAIMEKLEALEENKTDL